MAKIGIVLDEKLITFLEFRLIKLATPHSRIQDNG